MYTSLSILGFSLFLLILTLFAVMYAKEDMNTREFKLCIYLDVSFIFFVICLVFLYVA